MNKHQLKTEATKRRLLKSAQRIFARDGFEASKIDEIAEHAGYTRGAFYAHFQSKEDLFFALLEQQIHLHSIQIQRLAEAATNERERLEALRTYYAKKAGDRQWSILNMEFKLFALRRTKFRAKLAQTHRKLRAQMRVEGIQKLLPDSAMEAGQKDLKRVVLEAVLNGLLLESAYDPRNISPAQAEEALGRVFDLVVHSRQL